MLEILEQVADAKKMFSAGVEWMESASARMFAAARDAGLIDGEETQA